MLSGYLVSMAHKNKIPTATHVLSGLTFSMAITFTSPGGVAVIPEIDMVDEKRKLFQFSRCCSNLGDVRLDEFWSE